MLAPGVLGLGVPELLIILVVLLLIFGATRLADIGGSLGKGIREFRRNVRDSEAAEAQSKAETSPVCPNCGADNDPQAKFCAECGTELRATVK
jgi:sec-independent protein translocase protein TatA